MFQSTNLKTDSIFSKTPREVGFYQTDIVQALHKCDNANARCSVRHVRSDIDVESSLRNLDKQLSKRDPPVVRTSGSADLNIKPTPADPWLSESIGTRERRANNVLSGVSIDRFENPIVDPQLNVVFNEPQRGGLHTRNNAKDLYKK